MIAGPANGLNIKYAITKQSYNIYYLYFNNIMCLWLASYVHDTHDKKKLAHTTQM